MASLTAIYRIDIYTTTDYKCFALRGVDNDGVATGVAFGNTAVKVFVTAPMSIAAVRYLPRTVEATTGQFVVLDCSSGCSENSTAYLAAWPQKQFWAPNCLDFFCWVLVKLTG